MNETAMAHNSAKAVVPTFVDNGWTADLVNVVATTMPPTLATDGVFLDKANAVAVSISAAGGSSATTVNIMAFFPSLNDWFELHSCPSVTVPSGGNDKVVYIDCPGATRVKTYVSAIGTGATVNTNICPLSW